MLTQCHLVVDPGFSRKRHVVGGGEGANLLLIGHQDSVAIWIFINSFEILNMLKTFHTFSSIS